MLEVNNELSAEAASHSVMTGTDFHLGGDSRIHINLWGEIASGGWRGRT